MAASTGVSRAARSAGQTLRSGALAAVLLALPTLPAQSYLISSVPMVVPSALEPNLIVSLDDSPGMANAFPTGPAFAALTAGPNALAGDGSRAPASARRFKSSTFNPMYYDPNVQYVAPAGALTAATSFDAALINGYFIGGGSLSNWRVDLGSAYRPTLSFDAAGSAQRFADHAAADLGTGANQVGTTSPTGAGAAYYYRYDPALPGCTASVDDDGCYRLQRVTATSGPGGSDERQNFANWYSYYRTRHLAMISSAWRVLSDPRLSGTRVAWQALHACASFAAGSNCSGYDAASNGVSGIPNLIDEFGPARLAALHSWLRRLRPAAAGTSPAAPLRAALARAGQYYAGAASSNNPYLQAPQANASPTNLEYACRPNFHLLVAGGLYDDPDDGGYCAGGNCGDADARARGLPDGTGYTGTERPYADGNGNSLADVAFHYWAADLRPTLPNVLLPYLRDRSGGSAAAQYWNPRNDPARWQHMVNFVVGIGLGAALAEPRIPWTGSSFAGPGYASLVSGSAAWPAIDPGSTGRAYDLWHAALNSRGEFFGADAAEQVVAAMSAALARSIDQANVGAALAANSTRLTTESLLYQASFDTRDWTGRLRAIRVNTDGSLGADLWQAAAGGNIPAHDARRIFTSSAPAGSGIDFTWSALGAAGLQGRIGDEATLNYLRGDASGEIAQGGSLRDRGARLGDIVNSEIAFSGAEDFGYESLIVAAGNTVTGEGLAYPTYLLGKAARPKLVIAGANDGMLHGFDADTGAERFAYVPRALLLDAISAGDQRSTLVRLADPAYTHRFYVDGSPWVGDAYWGGAWRTVVVGATGAGGKGVFALDITSPTAMTAGHVLWDLDGHSDPDLGHTIGQAVIGRLHDGHFYAIFGNGYRSGNECPVLYLVRLHDGQMRKIPTGGRALGASCAGTPNGLGRPSLYDAQTAGAEGYRVTDYAYAGDLQGNLWRFDLRSVNLANEPATGWSVQLLFTARNASSQVQPITGTIEIGAALAEVPAPAAMLWFGTGRYFAVDDRVDATVQSMYGIVDRFGSGAGATVSRSSLVAQTADVASGAISGAAVPYAAAGNSRRDGWVLDLPRAGERMVGLPLVQRGRLVFATLIPDDDKCAGGGTSSLLAVDAHHGHGLAQRIFVGQPALDFIDSTVGIVRNLVYIGTGTHAYLYAGGTSGSVQVEEVRPFPQAGGRGRVSWREIVK